MFSEEEVRVKHKAWFFSGAALGLAIEFGMKLYEKIWMLGEVRPIVRWLFWPTSFFMDRWSPNSGLAALFALVVLGNALLYGFLAWILRRASIGVVALMLVGAWIIQPPSDSSLTTRFVKHRGELERLVQMANSDAQFSRIEPNLVETVDGQEHRTSDARTVLPQARWAEYRRLFEATRMNDGLYRNAATGDVLLGARTLGRVGPVVAYFGYLYCSAVRGQMARLEPCRDSRESVDRHSYRWRKLDSDWYIYEVFGGYGIE
jgi:hypothetical protein